MLSVKVFLTGFMGSGKTFTLNHLRENKELISEKLGPSLKNILFDDLDELILSLAGKRIGDEIKDFEQLFKLIPLETSMQVPGKKVDFSFRELERELLSNIISCNKEGLQIISLGGGALGSGGLEIIEKDSSSFLVFLDTPLEICLQRVREDQSIRPLGTMENEDLRKLYNLRMPLYKKADYHCSVLDNLFAELLEVLVTILDSRHN